MTDSEGTAAKRRVDIDFLPCCDATVFAAPVLLTDTEEQGLRALLASLQDFGLILRPDAAARRQHYDRRSARPSWTPPSPPARTRRSTPSPRRLR